MTFSVTVRDHMMIAHSLHGDVFGPARRLHGATYVVDATFRAAELDADGIVIDIGLASRALRDIIEPLTYRNLDDVRELAGINTTTEQLCRHIGDRLATSAAAGVFSPSRLTGIVVTLHESHIAWASYEVEL
ncbi:MAG: 6-carboxytetrahydropterin synthase [Actinomycetota bacterium]